MPARLLRSRALINLGEVDQARTELTQTATQFPDLPEARLQVAALDLSEKNFKAAEESFKNLYAKFRDPRALMGLVETHIAQGNSATASKKLLREEIAKNPGSTFNIGWLSLTSRSIPRTTRRYINEYGAVLDKMPRSSGCFGFFVLGETYRRSGDLTDAAANFKKAKELSPNSVLPYLQLALLSTQPARRPTLVLLYEQILQLQPDNPVAS